MRSPFLFSVYLLLLVGCEEAWIPPPPVDPVPAGVVIPAGMPNDVWFHENVLKSDVPVLVDFTATWCPPCQQMKPSVQAIEKAYGSRLKVVEVDVDEHPYLSDYFRIKAIPQLIVVKDGQIQSGTKGGQTYSQLVVFLKPTLGMP